jgi:hypothetical protein
MNFQVWEQVKGYEILLAKEQCRAGLVGAMT